LQPLYYSHIGHAVAHVDRAVAHVGCALEHVGCAIATANADGAVLKMAVLSQ